MYILHNLCGCASLDVFPCMVHVLCLSTAVLALCWRTYAAKLSVCIVTDFVVLKYDLISSSSVL